jgi:hypothetical protein
MNQERLKLLKELLTEAQQALPKARHFSVVEKDGSLVLAGESTYTNNGSYDDYLLLPSGEVEHKQGAIY